MWKMVMTAVFNWICAVIRNWSHQFDSQTIQQQSQNNQNAWQQSHKRTGPSKSIHQVFNRSIAVWHSILVRYTFKGARWLSNTSCENKISIWDEAAGRRERFSHKSQIALINVTSYIDKYSTTRKKIKWTRNAKMWIRAINVFVCTNRAFL